MNNNALIEKKGFYVIFSKATVKLIVDYLFLIISFLNSALLSIWLVFVSLSKTAGHKQEGAIEAFILIQLRSIVNPGIAAPMNSVEMIKWGCVFLLSFYILLKGFHQIHSKTISNVIILLFIFAIYLITAALLVSSYPTVAVFKIISYVVPFVSIIVGVNNTKNIPWIKIINRYLGILVIASIVTIPFPFAYLRTGHSFQGLLNHPNMFGIIAALFLAGLFAERNSSFDLKVLLLTLCCMCMIYLSKSRTGLISSILLFVIYIVCSEISKKKKSIIIASIGAFIIFLFLIDSSTVMEYINEFIYKGNTETIFSSRESQIEKNMVRFLSSPIIGTGFNVPYARGVRSFGFSTQLITENGNLIMALLGDTGIIGFALFAVVYGYMFRKRHAVVLFWAPIIISFGEMVFFSTNNIGIFLYLYYSINLAIPNQRSRSIDSI